MFLQDLDPSERPAESLALQRGERERHDALAERLRNVQALISRLEHPQRRLSIFCDAPLLPAADLLERRTPQQPHCSGKDDRVAIVPRRHRRPEEVLVRIGAGRQIGISFPVSVILRRLDERYLRVGKVSGQRLQVAGIDDVVRVDDTDDLGLGRGESTHRKVECACFEPRPIVDVLETHARAIVAVVGHGLPNIRILGVVVDDHDLEIGVIDELGRLDRFDKHVGRLVVRGDLQRDHRHMRRVEFRLSSTGDTTAHRIARIERIPAG